MVYLTEMEWDHIITKEGLKRYVSHTITDEEEPKARLKEIRKRGYALNGGEIFQGVQHIGSVNRSWTSFANSSTNTPAKSQGKQDMGEKQGEAIESESKKIEKSKVARRR